MSKWHVNAAIHAGAYVGDVEADSAEEALEKARELDCNTSLCWSCARKLQDPEPAYFVVENDDGTESLSDEDDPQRRIDELKEEIAALKKQLKAKGATE